MPCGQKKQNINRGNIVTNSIKTLKMVRIKKISLKKKKRNRLGSATPCILVIWPQSGSPGKVWTKGEGRTQGAPGWGAGRGGTGQRGAWLPCGSSRPGRARVQEAVHPLSAAGKSVQPVALHFTAHEAVGGASPRTAFLPESLSYGSIITTS